MKVMQRATLIEGPIGKMLVSLTIPMIFGTMAIMAFYLADTFFVGFLGTIPLAAIGFTSPVVLGITGFSIGLGGGVTAVLSRAIGGKNRYKIERLIIDSLILALSISAILLVIGILTIVRVFRLLGASHLTMPLIRAYMKAIYAGVFFFFIQATVNSIFRAYGDTLTPSLILLAATGLNILLDPLLIFGKGPFPSLEMTGAGIATAVSLALPPIFAIGVLYRHHLLRFLPFPKPGQMWQSWKPVLYIGLPSALSSSLLYTGLAVITNLIASYGPSKVAAFGVALRVETLIMTIMVALTNVLGPFIGQNLGAERFDRIRKGVSYCRKFAVAWGLGVALLLAIVSRPVAHLFTHDPEVVSAIIMYLCIAPIGLSMHGLLMLTNTSLNVLNRPIQALFFPVAEIFLFTIPLAFIGSRILGLYGIFGATAIGRIIAGTMAYLWLKRVLLQDLKPSD